MVGAPLEVCSACPLLAEQLTLNHEQLFEAAPRHDASVTRSSVHRLRSGDPMPACAKLPHCMMSAEHYRRV